VADPVRQEITLSLVIVAGMKLGLSQKAHQIPFPAALS
jgi:hypothetical protein